MLRAEGSLSVSGAMAAQAFVVRVWAPAGADQTEVFKVPLPGFHPVWVNGFQVWVYTDWGALKRGVVVELLNLMSPEGDYLTLPTLPSQGCQGFNGIRYHGPPFKCNYGLAWRTSKGALSATDVVKRRIDWEGMPDGVPADVASPAPCKLLKKSTRRRSKVSRARAAA
jgi:hypothetical protein